MKPEKARQARHAGSTEDRKLLDGLGIGLTAGQCLSLRPDVEAVRRNIERIDAVDIGPAEPAITLLSPARR